MEAAKASVNKFISKSGHHDTTHHKSVAAPVQNETVAQTQHERAQTAVDREVHQDHYTTTEQPVTHSETLPEQHHHKLVPTEHREFEHDDADDVKRKLAAEQSKYRDSQTRVDGERTTSTEPSVAGEHVHHHVHETIQPVVQKQTVEPHVVHTTVPVHEVHHNAAQHHASTALPAMSMDDFKKSGGALGGRQDNADQYHGCPPEEIAGHKPHTHDHEDAGMNTGTSKPLPVEPTRATNTSSSSSSENGHLHDSQSYPQPATYGNDMHPQAGSTTSTKKPSFMDKLNPKKDADGDGKPGFMK